MSEPSVALGPTLKCMVCEELLPANAYSDHFSEKHPDYGFGKAKAQEEPFFISPPCEDQD